jgi:tRNA threonylcarbamoyladenosine biosynthesis protein TsaE
LGYAPAMPAPTALRRETTSPDPGSTHALGAALAGVAEPGDVLCLWGELGAGKTQLAKGFGVGLGVTDTVTSPSFILMAEYEGRLRLFHIDLYRLDGPEEVIAGGLLDDREATGVTLIEWPDRLGAAVPRRRLDVRIDGSGDAPRTIRLEASEPSLARYLDAVP